MINIQNILVEALNKGHQGLDQDKKVMVRLEDVVNVLNDYNAELEAEAKARTAERSKAMKAAWEKKKGDKKKGKK